MERHAKTVRGKRPWRLRTRLTLALVALFVAIAALVVASHYQYPRDRRDSRIENVETVSRTLAAVVDGFTRDLESFALSTTITLGEGRTPFDQGLSAERRDSTRSYLSHLHQRYGNLRSIFVTNLAGRVVVSESDESTGLAVSCPRYARARPPHIAGGRVGGAARGPPRGAGDDPVGAHARRRRRALRRLRRSGADGLGRRPDAAGRGGRRAAAAPPPPPRAAGAARPLVPADADVSQLASAIEEMSRAIAEREQRLSTQASVLEAIERTGGVLGSGPGLGKVVGAGAGVGAGGAGGGG